jgi:hypothetical protein
MLRRTLQFVLMLAVLLSTSAAQAHAMPCCEIAHAAMATPVAPVAAHDEGPEMHCHSGMQTSEAVPMPHCTAASCTAQSETATASTEDAALQPLVHASAVSLKDVPVTATGTRTVPTALFVPPDSHQRAPVPLRV